jgi:hypothetical protein
MLMLKRKKEINGRGRGREGEGRFFETNVSMSICIMSHTYLLKVCGVHGDQIRRFFINWATFRRFFE